MWEKEEERERKWGREGRGSRRKDGGGEGRKRESRRTRWERERDGDDNGKERTGEVLGGGGTR